MASFKVFARRIQRRARQVETGGSAAVRATALVINQTVIFATPKDTGHAKANWQVGIDSPITKEIDEEDPGQGEATIGRNAGMIRAAPKGMKSIILSNNVPYINRLNEGSSSQAPAQFVQIAILDAITAVRKTRFFK